MWTRGNMAAFFDKQHRHVGASALAAFIGEHPYQSMVSVWFEILRKTDPLLCSQLVSEVRAECEPLPLTAATIVSKYKVHNDDIEVPKTVEDIEDAVSKKRKQVSEAIVRTEAPQSLPDEVKSEIMKYAAVNTMTSNLRARLTTGYNLSDTEIETSMQLAQKTADLVNAVAVDSESAMNCSYGIAMESSVKDSLPNASQIVKDNKYKSIFVHTTSAAHRWFIGGRTDGIVSAPEDSTKTLAIVEIKNRKNTLYTVVPKYERIQCECYMRIWDSPSIQFVQQLNFRARGADQRKSTQSTMIFGPNDHLWSSVLAKFQRYAELFDTVLLRDHDKLKWLTRESMSDKSRHNDWVLRKWISEFL